MNMNPNANIEEQRRLVVAIARLVDCKSRADNAAHNELAREGAVMASRLAELIQALDGWLCSGGALPRTWERK
jgi:hypothetical protein